MVKILISADMEKSTIQLVSDSVLPFNVINELVSVTHTVHGNFNVYLLPLLMYNAFVVSSLYNSKTHTCAYKTEDSKQIIESYANNVKQPEATMLGDSHVGVTIPAIPSYQRLMTILNANLYRLQTFTIPIARLYEVYRYLVSWEHSYLPKFNITPELFNKVTERISQSDEMKDLFNIELVDLFSVKTAYNINLDSFTKLKYQSAVDILLHRPTRYTDRGLSYSFSQVPFGEKVYVRGIIQSFSTNFNNHAFMTLEDKYGRAEELIFWKQGFLTRLYKTGDEVFVEVSRKGRNGFNGISIIPIEEVAALPVAPVYRQAQKGRVTTKLLTNSVEELLMRFNGEKLVNYLNLNEDTFWGLLQKLHFPKNGEELEKTIEKLAFIELVYMQLLFLEKRARDERPQGIAKLSENPKMYNEAISNLPYELTNAQSAAISTVVNRLNSPYAADMLLSGDTGSGKSTVAVATCLYNVDCGYQAALVAPTEILAEQLYLGFMKAIENLSVRPNVVYLTGATKTKEANLIKEMVSNGTADVVIGTHAVTNLSYRNLGLIVIDEEQKFGKNQKEILLSSRLDGKTPDLLSQTATPIPRSTALAFYGDVDLITLAEKPKGRKENITKWIKTSSDDFLSQLTNEVWSHIYTEIENDHQVFIVTPAVSETAKSASVEKTKSILSAKFPDLKIDTVHGQMTKDQQTKKLQKFRDNKTNVLIASSIIEVGIDIPNSTIMLVLDANRFGASSLHQIRGRVGRSDLQGYCYLIAEGTTDNSKRRLQSLVDSNNGFDIALVDLETRKEGDLFGERQSGETNLKFCDFVNHTSMIELAKNEAERIYNSAHKEQALLDANTFLRR